MTKQKTLLVIDGDGLIARAHFGAGGNYLMGTQKIGGVYSAINKVRYLISIYDADSFIVAFDPTTPSTFRHKQYAQYKANRPPKEEDHIKAKELFVKAMRDMGAYIVENSEYEADDIVYTAAIKAAKKGWRAVASIGDKDALGLLGIDNVIVQPPYDNERYTMDKFKEKFFGIEPAQIDDILAMKGDDVDNIPGITQCGYKRGAQLLLKYGTLENILDAANKGEIKGELGKNLVNEGKRALAFRNFLKLRDDVPNVPEPEDAGFGTPDYASLFKMFSTLGFHDLAKEAREGMNQVPSLGM